MNYLLARNTFLKSCGDPTWEEREWVIQQFDKTPWAAQARLADAWMKFWNRVRFW